MRNPWTEIPLVVYKAHMRREEVYQLQTLSLIMRAQFRAVPALSAMVLGVAGGNGLEQADAVPLVYGVDINRTYLEACARRFPDQKRYRFVQADLCEKECRLPEAELLVADLLFEYIGLDAFAAAVCRVQPLYVSCVLQRNEEEDFVSDSPYRHSFDSLQSVYRSMDAGAWEECMRENSYFPCFSELFPLPNGKSLLRLDAERGNFPREHSTADCCEINTGALYLPKMF